MSTYTAPSTYSPLTGQHSGATYHLVGIETHGTVSLVSVSGENGRTVTVEVDSTKPDHLAGVMLPDYDRGFIAPALHFLAER